MSNLSDEHHEIDLSGADPTVRVIGGLVVQPVVIRPPDGGPPIPTLALFLADGQGTKIASAVLMIGETNLAELPRDLERAMNAARRMAGRSQH